MHINGYINGYVGMANPNTYNASVPTNRKIGKRVRQRCLQGELVVNNSRYLTNYKSGVIILTFLISR